LVWNPHHFTGAFGGERTSVGVAVASQRLAHPTDHRPAHLLRISPGRHALLKPLCHLDYSVSIRRLRTADTNLVHYNTVSRLPVSPNLHAPNVL
jgi:hypothetical protein